MININDLIRYCALGPAFREDHLKATVAMFAGMKRHSLGVRTRFYVARAVDNDLSMSFAEPGLAIFFRGQLFTAGGQLGWGSIERGARARLDAALDAMPGAVALSRCNRDYSLTPMPHSDPAFYQATLSQVDPAWIFRAEIGTGLALVPSIGTEASD